MLGKLMPHPRRRSARNALTDVYLGRIEWVKNAEIDVVARGGHSQRSELSRSRLRYGAPRLESVRIPLSPCARGRPGPAPCQWSAGPGLRGAGLRGSDRRPSPAGSHPGPRDQIQASGDIPMTFAPGHRVSPDSSALVGRRSALPGVTIFRTSSSMFRAVRTRSECCVHDAHQVVVALVCDDTVRLEFQVRADELEVGILSCEAGEDGVVGAGRIGRAAGWSGNRPSRGPRRSWRWVRRAGRWRGRWCRVAGGGILWDRWNDARGR